MMKKRLKNRLLIYAHYYYPDVAATGQLLMELAEGLASQFDIRVICAVPSYSGVIEERYRERWFYKENINGIKVLRVRVPAFSKQNKRSRIKNIVAYTVRSMLATFMVGKQDYVLSISQPPVLGGLLGVWGSILKNAKFIYNIQDFNPEQIIAVGYSHRKWLLKLMMKLDCFCCSQADKVIVVGQDMEETLRRRFQGKKLPDYAVIHNWIDEKQVYPLAEDDEKVVAFREKYDLEGKFVIMYSGNMGLYYDLENLIKVVKRFCCNITQLKECEKTKEEKIVAMGAGWKVAAGEGKRDEETEEGLRTAAGREVVFAFVGAGSMLNHLILYKEKHHLENIVFVPYQDKEELIYSLNAADVHWCVNAKGLKGVSFPSKCYGIMAVGKPVLGVMERGAGARELIEAAECGLCCDSGDYEGVAKLIEWYAAHDGSEMLREMGRNGRKYLEEKLAKGTAFRRYAEEIVGCGEKGVDGSLERSKERSREENREEKLNGYREDKIVGLEEKEERLKSVPAGVEASCAGLDSSVVGLEASRPVYRESALYAASGGVDKNGQIRV